MSDDANVRAGGHGGSGKAPDESAGRGPVPPFLPHRLCVAPMMDWTDRHCRFFLRQISPQAFLYSEMITTGALLHGDLERHLGFDDAEHPVAAQLGGSEPEALAACARLVAGYGYDEVNLNIGCPSERVQKGAFGACLMAEPGLVADCVRAMCEAVALPITVKHRLGIDRIEDYGLVCDFVARVAAAGCRTFIVHARNAMLKGLSPKENRTLPPLRQRREDIRELTRFYLEQAANELGVAPKTLSSEAAEVLQKYDWPGNVRELVNVCRRLTVTAAGREIAVQDLPHELGGVTTQPSADWTMGLAQWAEAQLAATAAQPLLSDALPAFERTLIVTALRRARGKRLEAAKLLGWGRNTLTRKIKELGLEGRV